MRRARILLSAYACEPGRGSEPGVGWNLAHELARHHDVWCVTRANNRAPIEAALAVGASPHLHFEYYDLPAWSRWWKRGGRGLQAYYWLWQAGIFPVAQRLHREIGFDLVHHATFVKYWAPSFLASLPIPFVWGPVGGGESAPAAFVDELAGTGRRYEMMRDIGRWMGERDPFVRRTARQSRLALATTPATAARLEALGTPRVRVFSQLGLSDEELDLLGGNAHATPVDTFRVIGLGNLLHWKGFHLGLRAFALGAPAHAEYWIVGDGPERARLEALATELGIRTRVRFWGRLPRMIALEKLAASDVLLHPSLHDSGGGVCLEAMAAAKPVVCLDLGGPALQVTEETGIVVPAHHPAATVQGLARALERLATDRDLRIWFGTRARRRARSEYRWQVRGERLNQLYHEAGLL